MLKSLVPIISPNDKLKYLVKELANRLQVVLVSDPETHQSAATMCVRCGSLEDPKNFQGLAHFLEHMLFMGSDRFPEPGEYRKFITENGGDSNAYTSLDQTVYYFNIVDTKFKDGLERFASFFTCSKLTEACAKAEIHAVNSEHEKNLTSDTWKEFQLTRHLARKSSPLNGFSTGNLETLAKDGVYQALNDFYRQKYSANIMRLVIYGREPLQTLEQHASELFESVNNRNLPGFSYNKEEYGARGPEDLGTLVCFQTESKVMRLKLSWQFRYHPEEWDKDPFKLFSHVLGHESEGSLLSGLKHERLAFNLMADGSPTSDIQANFELSIGLTESGWKSIPRVLQYVGNYIRMLQQNQIPKEIFNEVKKMNEIKFRFQEKKSPIDRCTDLACRQIEVPLELILKAPYMLEEFLPERNRSILEALSLPRCTIILANNVFESTLDQIEPIYKTPYSQEKIPKEWEAAWNAAPDAHFYNFHLPKINKFIPENLEVLKLEKERKPKLQETQQPYPRQNQPAQTSSQEDQVHSDASKGDSSGLGGSSKMPHLYQGHSFKEGFQGHHSPSQSSSPEPGTLSGMESVVGDKNKAATSLGAHPQGVQSQTKAPVHPKSSGGSGEEGDDDDPEAIEQERFQPGIPERILSSPQGVTWFKQDDIFLVPKIVYIGYVYHDMHQPFAYTRNRAYARLWSEILSEYLNEFTYLASMANLRADNIPGRRGFTLTITGYSDSFKNFMPEYGRMLSRFVGMSETEDGLAYLTDQFRQQKEKTIIKEHKRRNREPFRLAYEALDGIFLENIDSDVEWLAHLEATTEQGFLEFHKQIFRHNYYEELFLGNLLQKEAVEMSRHFYENFLRQGLSDPLSKVDVVQNKVIRLRENQTLILRKDVFNKKELNSNLLMVYQADASMPEEFRHRQKFLGQLAAMVIEDKFFDDLRTTQQLGYVVMSGFNDRKDVYGIFFLVQSQKKTPSEVAEKVYEFLDKFRGCSPPSPRTSSRASREGWPRSTRRS